MSCSLNKVYRLTLVCVLSRLEVFRGFLDFDSQKTFLYPLDYLIFKWMNHRTWGYPDLSNTNDEHILLFKGAHTFVTVLTSDQSLCCTLSVFQSENSR